MAYLYLNFFDHLTSGSRNFDDFYTQSLAEQYEGRVKIGKYNVEESSEVATEFGIRSIPTILFFRDGKLVDKNVGSISKSNLEEKINALL